MNRALSSRTGLLSIVALTGLAAAAAAACSSNSTQSTPPNEDDASESTSSSGSGNGSSGTNGGSSGTSGGSSGGTTSSSGGSSSGPPPAGDGGMSCVDGGFCTVANTSDGGCPTQMSVTLGVHVHFDVSWPASSAPGAFVAGSAQPVDIWLLSAQTGETTFTGMAKTCGTTLPPIVLGGTGEATICPPSANGMCPPDLQIAFNTSIWDTIPTKFSLSGSTTSWNPGGTLMTTPSLGVLGLKSSAAAAAAGGTWPAGPAACIATGSCTCTGSGMGSSATFTGTCGLFAGSDISDDDDDGNPGITSNPISNTMYSLPPTSIQAAAVPPLADKVYIVTRNQIALSGMRMNSCTSGSGTATVSLFDNHVVGCHATAGTVNGTATAAGPCNDAEVGFVDNNRTIYGASNGMPASTSNTITGTVKIAQMAPNATCAEVRTIN